MPPLKKIKKYAGIYYDKTTSKYSINIASNYSNKYINKYNQNAIDSKYNRLKIQYIQNTIHSKYNAMKLSCLNHQITTQLAKRYQYEIHKYRNGLPHKIEKNATI